MKQHHVFFCLLFCCGIALSIKRWRTTASGIPQVPFYFIRHGQTDWNLHPLTDMKSSNNAFLNATGIKQAEAAAQKLKDTPIKVIITSPYWRTRQTAAIIARELNKPVIVLPWIMERDRVTPEDKPLFRRRIQQGLNYALRYPGPVLIVGHGGTGSAIERILNRHRRYFSNAEPVLFQPTENHWNEYAL